MRKLLRKLLLLVIFLLLITTAVVIVKTVGFASRQIAVEQIEKYPLADAVLENLSEAVRIPTISRTRATADTTSFFKFHQFLDSQFVLVDSLLEKYTVNELSLVYKWPGRNSRLKPVLLMGHSDVVPVEEISLQDWEKDPFGGEISDGYIWGRGTLDDKINIVGLMESVEILLKEGYEPERTIYFAFGHDEEVRGLSGAKIIARQFEEQGINFEFVLDEGSIIMNDAMPGLDAPLAMIGIGEKGYTTLTLTSKLEDGGHSSMPPKESAIGLLGKAINKLSENPFPARIEGATGQLFEYVGPEMKLPQKAIFANLWLFNGLMKKELSKSSTTNAIIRTTVAPTLIRGGIKENVLPTQASARINFRIIPGEDLGFVHNYVKNVIADPRVVVSAPDSIESINPSPISDTESFGYKVIQRSIQQVFPEAIVAPSLIIAATDSRFFTKVSDNIFRFTPVLVDRPDLKRIHGLNERVGTEAYKNAIRFYKQLIVNSSR